MSRISDQLIARLTAVFLRVGELLEISHTTGTPPDEETTSRYVQGQWTVLNAAYRNQRFTSAEYNDWELPAYLVRIAGDDAAMVGDSLVIAGRQVSVRGVYKPEVDDTVVSTELVCARDLDEDSAASLAAHEELIASHTILGHVRIGYSLTINPTTGMLDIAAGSVSTPGSVTISPGDPLDFTGGTVIGNDDRRLRRLLWLQLLPVEPAGAGLLFPAILLPGVVSRSLAVISCDWTIRQITISADVVGSTNTTLNIQHSTGDGPFSGTAILTDVATLEAGDGRVGVSLVALLDPDLPRLSTGDKFAVDIDGLGTGVEGLAVWMLLEQADPYPA